jgi:hypothetical protein
MNRSDYHKYLASREWALLKEQVRKRSGGACERCKVGLYAATHHLTYERLGHERLEDLLAVCEPCHEFLSGKSDVDPLKKPEYPEYYMEAIYVHPLPWVDHWGWTFADPKTEESLVLGKCIERVAKIENPVLLDYETHFGVVPMGTFPGMALWAARSVDYLAKTTLGIKRCGGLLAAFDEFPWISTNVWRFFVKHFIGVDQPAEIVAESDLTEEERIVAAEEPLE